MEESHLSKKYVLVQFEDDSVELVRNSWFNNSSASSVQYVSCPPIKNHSAALKSKEIADPTWEMYEVRAIISSRDDLANAMRLRQRYNEKEEVETTDLDRPRKRQSVDRFVDMHVGNSNKKRKGKKIRSFSPPRLHLPHPLHPSPMAAMRSPPPQSAVASRVPPPHTSLSVMASSAHRSSLSTAASRVPPHRTNLSVMASSAHRSSLSTAASRVPPPRTNLSVMASSAHRASLSTVASPVPCASQSSAALSCLPGSTSSEQASSDLGLSVPQSALSSIAHSGMQENPISLEAIFTMLKRSENVQRAMHQSICDLQNKLQDFHLQYLCDRDTQRQGPAATAPSDRPILLGLPLTTITELEDWAQRLTCDRRCFDDALIFFKRLGGKKLSTVVQKIMYHIMDDNLAQGLSLKGAVRCGISKSSFSTFGLLPFIRNVVWCSLRDAKGDDIDKAVADHLRQAVTRQRRKQGGEQSDGGERSRERSGCGERNRKRSSVVEWSRERSGERSRERSRERSGEWSRERSGERSRERSGERSRERSGERSRERSGERSRERSGERSREWSRERSGERSREWSRERSGGRSREWSRERSFDDERSSHGSESSHYRSRSLRVDD